MDKIKLIGPFTELLPMAGLPTKGAIPDSLLEPIKDAGILVKNGQVLKVGDFSTLMAEAQDIERITTPSVALPGFIDAHTHICFGGSRATDYAMRNAGKTYLEIAKSGGGIWDTVTKTRACTKETLVKGIIERSKSHLKQGVTTLEVKSGYGLTVQEELKMLRAIKEADALCKPDLIATCLAAHMVPKDWRYSPAAYLEVLIQELFPQIKAEQLSTRIDAFVEESAFSVSEITPYLREAQAQGFEITLHADQFSTGGSQLAVALNSRSADHLEASTEVEINALAKSNTIAVALPGASLGLGCNFTPARKLLDAGACLAIASDHNPGSAPMGHLLAQAAILGSFEKLSNAEVLAGITYRAAMALNLNNVGVLESGRKADIVAFPTKNYQEITYKQGQLLPSSVWKNGQKVL